MLTIALEKTGFFHARPAAVVSAAAKCYESVIMVSVNTQIADAKNPLALMRLSCTAGAPLELLADGPDEQDALNAVAAAIDEAFQLEELKFV